MKVKVSELQGAALDWAVAACLNAQFSEARVIKVCRRETTTPAWIERENGVGTAPSYHRFPPSTDWDQGGPIIEREAICIVQGFYRQKQNDDARAYVCRVDSHTPTGASTIEARGSTPLVAAMRCYVASKMGDEIEIPDELTN